MRKILTLLIGLLAFCMPTGYAQSISGPTTVCDGQTVTMTGTPAGGTWSGLYMSVAVVGSGSGLVTGIAPGTTMVTYTLPSSAYTTMAMTVNPTPNIYLGTSSISCGASTSVSTSLLGCTYASSNPLVATVGPPGVTGISAGTATISVLYGPTGCSNSTVVTVLPYVSAGTISGPTSVCVGGAITLSSTVSGGSWSSTFGNASVSSAGVATGVTAGIDTIIYAVTSSCGTATVGYPITIAPSATVAPISGPSTMCVGDVTTFTCTTPGGTWSSSAPGVVNVTAATGTATAVATGATTLSYSVMLSCGTAVATLPVSVVSGTVSASVSAPACGDTYLAVAAGAATYSWLPTTGVSCPACATTSINPTTTTTYTVSGTTGGCTSMATITVNGNRIKGNVLYSGVAPSSPAAMVWLVQFNPADSSIVTTDSMNTCTDATGEYYEFDSKPAGNYLVKAKLLSATSGTSDYVPTYGASTTAWYMASNIAHSSATDVQDINMIYGTVPSGAGFIAGYVYAGAGKGTSGGAPVQGMLVYLKSGTTGAVLTYTYTDAAGQYTFTGLGYGAYTVYPEAYHWTTTPSDIITLTAESPNATGVTFKQHTNLGTITPYSTTGINNIKSNTGMQVYPNPTSGNLNISWNNQDMGNASVTITDVLGSTVYNTTFPMNTATGTHTLDLGKQAKGIYFINLNTVTGNFTSKLILE